MLEESIHKVHQLRQASFVDRRIPARQQDLSYPHARTKTPPDDAEVDIQRLRQFLGGRLRLNHGGQKSPAPV